MRVALNKAEYRLLNRLRGLPPGAQLMVITSITTPTGGALDGDPEDFEELAAFLREELESGTVPRGKLRTMMALCDKVAVGEA